MIVQTWNGPQQVTEDEARLLGCALFGETPAELAAWTALPVSRVRRLIKGLVARQLMDRLTIRDHESGREYKIYRRVGPED
ncbi:MAG: hypothetical protein MUC88_00230 [Planctomycetes bacterium]|jgi:hypothetical protein|nr:hypothetical protein [Planctomycetota bacterium]